MKIHSIPVGDFLGKVRSLLPDDNLHFLDPDLPVETEDVLGALEMQLPYFINVDSNLLIQNDVMELANKFQNAGSDLIKEVSHRFESTQAEDHILKTVYARMLLILRQGLCYPLTNRISHRDMYGDKEYEFSMKFLKSLNIWDKEQFIKEADCVNYNGLNNLASKLIEIVGDNKREAGVYVFRTIIDSLAEQPNPGVYTEVKRLPEDAIIRKQNLALYVLSKIDIKVSQNNLEGSEVVLSGVVDKLVEMAVYGIRPVQRANAISILDRFTAEDLKELLPQESKDLLLKAGGIDRSVAEKVLG